MQRTKEAKLAGLPRLQRLRAEKAGMMGQVPSELGRELDWDPFDDTLPQSGEESNL